MKIQTLVVTINQTDHALLSKMNIQTDAVIGNQCGKEHVDNFEYGGYKIQMINTATNGVGVNRNEIMMRAACDICVLADDDMTFIDGYPKIVQEWFEKVPDADILIFNLIEAVERRHKNKKVSRINRFNYSKYGAARIAFRFNSVVFAGIMFHTMFGGGCQYGCGEDTLFLHDCLEKGLKIYGVPAAIAEIEPDGNSTWFQGYNDKYFFDRGVLRYVLNGRWSKAIAILHCVKHRNKYSKYGVKKAIHQMWKGIDSVK